MRKGTYYKLREENKELKEKLSLYENGFSELVIEKNVVRASKYFEDSFNYTKKELEEGWKKYVEECKSKGIQHETQNSNVLNSIFDSLFNFLPNVSVTFLIGKETIRYNMMPDQWEWLKGLGEGDPSKGIDKLVRMYEIG